MGEDSPMAKLMLSVIGAIYEFDRALIKERQREGITQAKKRSAFKGGRKSLSEAAVTALRQRIETGKSKAQAARELGISLQPLSVFERKAGLCHDYSKISAIISCVSAVQITLHGF